LHSSFILGIMLVVPFGAESILQSNRKTWSKVAVRWGIFGLGATTASLLNPNGLDGVIYPIRAITMENIRYIQEWQPSNFSHFGAFELGLLAVIGSGLYLGARLSLPRLLVLLGATHMALSQFRHQFIFGLVACMLLGPAIAVVLRKRQDVGPSETAKARRAWYLWTKDPAVIIFGCLVLIFVAVRVANPVSLTESITRPVTALAAVPAELKDKPIFNDYGMAGYLIFTGVRPYIDGRSELYGDTFMKEFVQASEAVPAELFTLFKRHDIQWTLLQADSPINKVLARYPTDWALLYTDRYATVYWRTSPY